MKFLSIDVETAFKEHIRELLKGTLNSISCGSKQETKTTMNNNLDMR